EIALGQHHLQPRVLRLELAQSPHIGDLQRPVALSPAVDRLLANAMALRHLRHRLRVRLSHDADHLVFAESTLLNRSPAQLGEPSSQVSAGPKITGHASATVQAMLARLGIRPSFSRPWVS